MATAGGSAIPFSSRLALQWLSEQPDSRHFPIEGTFVFGDVSGFTALSERLARLGREGAEQLTEIIGTTFASLLADAYAEGGQLLAFGGDALLLAFTGEDHVARGARGARGLRRATREASRHRTDAGGVRLRISAAVHTGVMHAYLPGEDHRVLMLAGDGISTLLEAEHAARSGQIALTAAAAAALPARCHREQADGTVLLTHAPGTAERRQPEQPAPAWAGVARLALARQVRDVVEHGGDQPEHRTVSVAFVQLMGTDRLVSTKGRAAAATIDGVVRGIQQACAEYDVCLLASDVDVDGIKLILVTGAPRSSGQDEERLLLALRQILDTPSELRIRAGVHRGTVFSGQVGPAYRRTYTVMGDTVNLAARLMARAAPNSILATHDVVDRSRTPFVLTEVEPFAVKGKKAPVFAVVVGQVPDGATADDSERDETFVGRDHELSAMSTAWIACRDHGRGSSVEILGEPGIGKTSLLRAFLRREGIAHPLTTRGDLYSAASPYRSVRSLLLQALRVPPGTDEAGLEQRLRQVMADGGDLSAQTLPLLADVLALTVEETDGTKALAAAARVAATQRAVIELLARLLDQPTVLVVEDSHWVDEASALVLHRLATDAASYPWLLITTRRQVPGGFAAAKDVGTTLTPLPLDQAEAAELAALTMGERRLPPQTLRELKRRAGGNPLFLRELVMAAGEHDDLDTLPDSLDALLAARLDRLGPGDRELVCRASVLGERFAATELGYVRSATASSLAPSTLGRVSGFLRPLVDGQITFTHALMREAAYQTLPFRLRRQLHSAVAEGMVASGDAVSGAVLSFHYSAAGLWRQAWTTGRAAGQTAAAAYAPAEAATLLQRAVDAARRPAAGVDPRDRAEASLELARAYARSGNFSAADRALTVARREATDPLLVARLVVEQAWLAERQSRLQLAVRRAMSAQRTLTEVGEPTDAVRSCQAQALVIEGWARDVSGQHRRAASVLRLAFEQARAAGDERAQAHAGSILDWSLVMSGQPSDGAYVAEALEIYRALDDAPGQAICLTNLGAVAYLRGDWAAAVDYYRQGQQAYLRAGDETSAALGAANVGEVLSDQGHWDQAATSLREARSVWQSTQHPHGVAYATGLLGRTLARQGNREALAMLQESLAGHREVGAQGDADQVALWIAEAQLLWGDTASALEALGPSAGDESACAQRIRGSVAWLDEEASAAVEQLERAVRQARSADDAFEELAALVVLKAVSPDLDRTLMDRASALRERLGVVALAVLPSRD